MKLIIKKAITKLGKPKMAGLGSRRIKYPPIRYDREYYGTIGYFFSRLTARRRENNIDKIFVRSLLNAAMSDYSFCLTLVYRTFKLDLSDLNNASTRCQPNQNTTLDAYRSRNKGWHSKMPKNVVWPYKFFNLTWISCFTKLRNSFL